MNQTCQLEMNTTTSINEASLIFPLVALVEVEEDVGPSVVPNSVGALVVEMVDGALVDGSTIGEPA